MGLLQGMTEWLPVSSSGHLVLAQDFYGVQERTLFDAILHLGTLLAALVYFRKDLKPLLNVKNPMTHKIIIGSIPIIIVGFLIRDVLEAAFAFALVAAGLLIINGCVLMVNAFLKNPNNDVEEKNNKITMKSAIIIGIFQIFALFPGISRSGTTITTGRILGINWSDAAKFSFFISFLPLAGAAGLKIATAYHEFDVLYILGFMVAFVVGYATIDLMMHLLRQGRFHYFGVYTIILGILVILFIFSF
jgi:undecaprenyl-diphosphatase